MQNTCINYNIAYLTSFESAFMKDQTLSCRWLFVTWHPLHWTCTSPQSELLTSRSWPLLLKSSWRTWTKSLKSTTILCERWGVFCALAIEHYCNLLLRLIFSLTQQAENSNKRHRPIGIGVQGLADAFILMRFPFESAEAQHLNTQIFETIYYAALESSCELAAEFGPYQTYAGSPVSKGVS